MSKNRIAGNQAPVRALLSSESLLPTPPSKQLESEKSLQELEKELLLHAQIIGKQQRLLERCLMIMEKLAQTMEKITDPAAERPCEIKTHTH